MTKLVRVRRFLSCILCLTLLLGVLPAPALAEWTTLQVVFFGLTYGDDGKLSSTPLEGTFGVYQNGQELGEVTAAADGKSTFLSLSEAVETLLIPRMDTMPEGYAVVESGYAVSVTAGSWTRTAAPAPLRAWRRASTCCRTPPPACP